MGKKAKVAEEPLQRQTPAITPEGREDQMVAYAMDLAEQRLINGTASSQEILHWLRVGACNAKYEREKLQEEIKLLKAKTESIKADRDRDIMYAQAIEAMRRYTPHSVEDI